MKKTIFLCLLAVVLAGLSACSNTSVSRSKANNEVVATGSTSETTNTSGAVATALDSDYTQNKPDGLAIVFPDSASTYTTGLNWNVLRGVTSAETAAIEINGYRLHKYVAGSTNWNYIAATQMQTLASGNNEYVIKAFDAEDNVIDQISYQVNYQPGYTLPNVGAGLNIVFLLTLFVSSALLVRRQKA